MSDRNVSTLVFETGRPARIDRYADNSSGTPAAPRESGIRSAVGTPVIVEGRLWGLIFAGSTLEQPLPPDTETRLASFTELVATAIANADSRAALARGATVLAESTYSDDAVFPGAGVLTRQLPSSVAAAWSAAPGVISPVS